MTPLDRILADYPGVKELLLRVGDNLPLIVGGGLALLIVLVFFWTFVAAPRRAVRALRSLEREGYAPVSADDPQLRTALDRLTPIMFHTYALSTVTETSPWRVKLAYVRYDGRATRYFALINRSVSRTTTEATKIEHEFTIAFLEARALPFSHDLHLAGDHYKLDPQYGLRPVDEHAVGRLSAYFVVHTEDGELAPLPAGLEDALAESSALLSVQAEKKPASRSGPFLFHARLKFTSAGWALISSEYVYHEEKMSALREAVDRIARSLG